MENKKKESQAYRGLVKFFSSRVWRNIVFGAILFVSVLLMFMLDRGNAFRSMYLSFMDSNFMQKLLPALNVAEFNITAGAWALFFAILLIAIMLFLGNMLFDKILGKTIEKKAPDFRSKQSCKMFYGTIYYLVILIICAALIFVGYKLIVPMWNDWMDITLDFKDIDIIVNWLYTLLLCLIFVAAIVIALFLVYFVFKLIILFIAAIARAVKRFTGDVREEIATAMVEGVANGDFNPVNNPPKDAGSLFPTLVAIDEKAAAEQQPEENTDAVVEEDELTLEEIALRFQSFACNKHKIYYEMPLIRSFIAGLATSRLIILEGLSGTGKSMLPRMFAEFTNSNAFFAPVQATWRDKTDIFGFYSEFSRSFKTTNFLERLYGASYEKEANVMVLDEMNLSRIEYYFADFLSVLEYPENEWKIRVYEPQANQTLPAKLEDGYVSIPNNTWFVGTANTDDSTFTITDKVYDRAVVIDFKEKVMPIESDYNPEPINVSAVDFANKFAAASEDSANKLTKEDINKFFKICDFMREAFDVRFGNRIMVQIENFVPVYVALGGTKEEALDFMFSHKIMRKINGMFEDFVKEELVNLTKLLHATYGKGTFAQTESAIAKIMKRLV